jgi:hypothetical protein
MRNLTVAMATCFLLAAFGAAASDPCSSDGAPAAGIVQLTGGEEGSTFYVDDRNAVTGNGLWLYEESNGVWGAKLPGVYVGDPEHRDLQRGGPWCNAVGCILLDVDACWDERALEAGPDMQLI